MGGDDAPDVVVEGAVRAARKREDLDLLLFGPESTVSDALGAHADAADLPIRVVDAPDVIGMGEAPATAVKTKRNSSIHRGLGAHDDGAADAFVSAGNTGAVMAAAIFVLGRVPGVERPSIAGFFPTTEGFSIVLDIGSNVDCRGEHLHQFARMGTIYTERVLKMDAPSVALINVGEERGKGNEQVKAAYDLIDADDSVHFAGNIEGDDIFYHAADIVVCDGFVGNIMLKFGESITTVLPDMTRAEMERQELGAEEQQVVHRVLKGVLSGFDAEERGGAPLLGVDGHVLIGHGRSSALAVEQMIYSATELAREDLLPPMRAAFSESA